MRLAAVAIIPAALLIACTRTPEAARTQERAQPTTEAKHPSPYPDDFRQTWGDGKAEVSAYEVKLPSGHEATAICVFELERFSKSRSAIAGNYSGTDTVRAMKMHVVREFMPGAGDALTVFAALEPANGQPAGRTNKIVFAGWDWSGAVWRQLLLTGNRARFSWHSEPGEGDGQSTRVLEDQNAIPEDALPMAARRIAWPVLRLGQTGSYDVLASLSTAAIHNDRLAEEIRLTLSRDRSTTVAPAGSFRTHTFTAAWPNSTLSRTWLVEADPPHRIVRWQTSEGETGVLLGSDRIQPSAMSRSDIAGTLRRLGIKGRYSP